MYTYHLPLKPSRIARIAGTRNPRVIEEYQHWLMQKAYKDPLLTREQMAELLRRICGTARQSSQHKKNKEIV